MKKTKEGEKQGINRAILRLSIPAIVSNVTVPLLGICDTAISGHLGAARYLGAIAVGTMMLNVLTWLSGFLRMGTTGLVAQAFGAKNVARMAAILTASIVVALVIGGAAVILQTPLLALFLDIIEPEAEITQLASTYFRICIWGLPASLMTMAVTGWFIGRQNTLWPMLIAILSNVINIIISYLLAFPLGVGFKGVAIGTLSANWLGLLIAVVASRRVAGKNEWLVGVRRAFGMVGLRNFFGVNSDLFLRSACVMAVSMSVTAFGARMGDDILATNAVMMQFFTFFSFFMDGFAFTGEALCGRYAGEGNRRMVERSIRALLWWSAGIAVVFTALYLAGWRLAVDLLTDVESVRRSVASYHVMLLLIPAVTVSAFIFDGFYIGLTRTRRMLVVTLLATVAFFLVATVGVSAGRVVLRLPDNTWLWTAFLSYLFVRGAGLGVQLPNVVRKV